MFDTLYELKYFKAVAMNVSDGRLGTLSVPFIYF